MTSIFEILRDNWLLLLVGQYPQGPLGGIACTLIARNTMVQAVIAGQSRSAGTQR